ncbi:hypothetical protein M068_2354 [Bacteroides fragilis str. J38-1]|nr:hypothetical protein M068_2354 [Bacteroides fragilis str. J38-1]
MTCSSIILKLAPGIRTTLVFYLIVKDGTISLFTLSEATNTLA